MKIKKNEPLTFNLQDSTHNELPCKVWEFQEGPNQKRKFDLEDRLMEYASAVIDSSKMLPHTQARNRVAGQILRSGAWPFPNHGAAEAAESREDFIHKLKVCPKELRETRRWARLITLKAWAKNDSTLRYAMSESGGLIRIFHSSVQTAKRNALAEQRTPSDCARYPAGEAG